MQIIGRGSKLWKLTTCSVIAFLNAFKYLLQADNSMTDRAYMGEVLIQIWLKCIKNEQVTYLTNK